MRIRVIDLDGSVSSQRKLMKLYRPSVHLLRRWGGRIRLGCQFAQFDRFERSLARSLGNPVDAEPHINFLGSGDFHHVSLATLRRQRRPVNLLVIDNHPDWMQKIPFLHCGTWLSHAARLPQVKQIFHVGGDVDFDNAFQWLAPWEELNRGKIVVLPAIRRLRGWRWARIGNDPLLWKSQPAAPYSLPNGRLKDFLRPYRRDLASRSLYISLDKDVLRADYAPVNWDSGHLSVAQLRAVVESFLLAAGGNLAGIDIIGDWSEVRVRGLSRRLLHWIEHPSVRIEAFVATRANEQVNLSLMETIEWFARAASEQTKELATA